MTIKVKKRNFLKKKKIKEIKFYKKYINFIDYSHGGKNNWSCK